MFSWVLGNWCHFGGGGAAQKFCKGTQMIFLAMIKLLMTIHNY